MSGSVFRAFYQSLTDGRGEKAGVILDFEQRLQNIAARRPELYVLDNTSSKIVRERISVFVNRKRVEAHNSGSEISLDSAIISYSERYFPYNVYDFIAPYISNGADFFKISDTEHSHLMSYFFAGRKVTYPMEPSLRLAIGEYIGIKDQLDAVNNQKNSPFRYTVRFNGIDRSMLKDKNILKAFRGVIYQEFWHQKGNQVISDPTLMSLKHI